LGVQRREFQYFAESRRVSVVASDDGRGGEFLQDAFGVLSQPRGAPQQRDSHRFFTQVFSSLGDFSTSWCAQQFETAFLLAVDLGHHDLFMDLHYIAVTIGETEMAAAARAKLRRS
jgi:hypothetical protein